MVVQNDSSGRRRIVSHPFLIFQRPLYLLIYMYTHTSIYSGVLFLCGVRIFSKRCYAVHTSRTYKRSAVFNIKKKKGKGKKSFKFCRRI